MSGSLLVSTGNPITAVYAIPATRPGYSEYFVSTPPTSYHSPSWMSYPPEPEDVPPQWADSVSPFRSLSRHPSLTNKKNQSQPLSSGTNARSIFWLKVESFFWKHPVLIIINTISETCTYNIYSCKRTVTMMKIPKVKFSKLFVTFVTFF